MRLIPKSCVGVLAALLLAGSAGYGAEGAPVQNTTDTLTNLNVTTGQPTKGLHFAAGAKDGEQIALATAQGSRLVQSMVKPELLNAATALPPLALYTLTRIDQTGGDASLANATADNRFRYLVTSGGKQIAYVVEGVDAVTGAAKGVTTGVTPNLDLAQFVDNMAASDKVRSGSYEARLLTIRPLNSVVIWLKSDTDDADLIYPVEFPPKPLQSGTLYTVGDLIAAFQAETKQRLAGIDEQVAREAATRAENKRKVGSGEDSTMHRLKALQAVLETTLKALKEAPSTRKDEFIDKTIVEINQALADVSRGMDYVDAHPGTDPFLESTIKGPPFFWSPYGSADLERPGFNTAYRALSSAAKTLIFSLRDFIGAPGEGRPLIGDLGGSRDRIMRDVGVALTSLAAGATAVNRATALHPVPVASQIGPYVTPSFDINAYVPEKLGSISGFVLAPGGKPEAFVSIAFKAAVIPSPNPISQNTIYRGGIPATIADENGAFTVRDLPPGMYIITVDNHWAVGSAQPIEVKEGTETKLSAPIQLKRIVSGG